MTALDTNSQTSTKKRVVRKRVDPLRVDRRAPCDITFVAAADPARTNSRAASRGRRVPRVCQNGLRVLQRNLDRMLCSSSATWT